MPFTIVPASQVAQKPKKVSQPKGRPAGSSPSQKAAQQKSTISGKSKSTVVVAAYGARLFEPVMAKERPIYVHFKDFIVRDEDSITRFSEDGWFAIKFFLSKDDKGRNRCYLIYFVNPVDATGDYSLMQACQESIEYKVYEFFDDDEYVKAAKRKDREGLSPQDSIKFRLLSALGQAEQMIIKVLRDKITAEKFLKRQREFERQNQEWKEEFAKLEAEAEEEDAELENSNGDADSEPELAESIISNDEKEEDKEAHAKAREEVSGNGVPEQKVESRIESEIKSQPKPFVWGGKR